MKKKQDHWQIPKDAQVEIKRLQQAVELLFRKRERHSRLKKIPISEGKVEESRISPFCYSIKELPNVDYPWTSALMELKGETFNLSKM